MKSNRTKIVIAHPGKQHSFRLAQSLDPNLFEVFYITTVYYLNSNRGVFKLLDNFISQKNRRRFKSRRIPDFPDANVVLFNRVSSLFLLALYRLDNKKRISEVFRKIISKSFQYKLAKYVIKNNIEILITYDSNSETVFSVLNKNHSNVIKIIDHSTAARNYLYDVSRKFNANGRVFYDSLRSHKYLYDKKYADNSVKEIFISDYHIVASEFSKKSLEFNNIKAENIIKLQYGVDDSFINFKRKNSKSTLNVIWIGEINERKGLSYLLKIVKDLKSYDINFLVVGEAYGLSNSFTREFKGNVKFYGRISKDELIEVYKQADLLLFTTLGEGFGLVLLEALASGIPIISSPYSGAPDLIKEALNGHIVEPNDLETIKSLLIKYKNSPEELSELKDNTHLYLKEFTWDNYKTKLNLELLKLFSSSVDL